LIDAVAVLSKPLAVALVLEPGAASDVAWAPAPFAVAVALLSPSDPAVAKASSPDTVAAAWPPLNASAVASAPAPDAELSVLLPSSANESATPRSEALAVALLGGPVAASQMALVPSGFMFVTFMSVSEHDSLSEAANAMVRATVRASTTAAIAAPI